jgi:uncharacterized protein YdaL
VETLLTTTPIPTAINVPTGPESRSLILYDSNPALPYNKLGLAYAIMLRNLLGHFGTQVDFLPVENYTAGTIAPYQFIFYLGTLYDNSGVPPAFLTDVSQTSQTVVWFKYNLWKLTGDAALNFVANSGVNFSQLRSLDGTPSAATPNPGFFDTVLFKGKDFVKFYNFDATTGTVHADPDVGVTQIVDTTKAQALVMIKNSHTAEQVPYIVRSGNFWYVADVPFSFIGPRDRYLVMCDILHDILNSQIQEIHRALVRLEDVGALVDPAGMKTLTDYMYTNQIPFSIAVIPFYRDPLGKYNGGVPQQIRFRNATNLLSSLRYAMPRGGKIVMHGYTHQYASTLNPHTGVSGDDFEFWDIVRNAPVAADTSVAWADGRLRAGLAELATRNIVPFAFELPHYQGSPNTYAATILHFRNTYQRVVYYTSAGNQMNLNPADPNRDFAVGQFFPYIIESDYYGQRVLPENLGNIEYDISDIDPTSTVVYTWQDIAINAQYARTIRDGFASFFFHPFWVEQELNLPAFQDFQSLIQAITSLGFQWVDPSQL